MPYYLAEFPVFPIFFAGFSCHEIYDFIIAHDIFLVVSRETDLELHFPYFVILELGFKIVKTFTDGHMGR